MMWKVDDMREFQMTALAQPLHRLPIQAGDFEIARGHDIESGRRIEAKPLRYEDVGRVSGTRYGSTWSVRQRAAGWEATIGGGGTRRI